ncbi:MAG: polysaccharide biosynthesis tyrosine autokinase [Cyanobacteria bacterium P01_C01_bin.73]
MGVTYNHFGESISNGPPRPVSPELGYGQLLAILLRRGLWLVGGVGLGVAAAAALTWRTQPTYESAMQLIVEPNFQEDVRQTEDGRGSDRQRQTDYATQLNLLRSDQFLNQAVDELTATYPNLTLGEIKQNFGLVQVEEDGVETRIFEAVYSGDDPGKTQAVLDTLKQIYLDYNLEQQQQRLSRGLASIDKQLEVARENLSDTQDSLEIFRRNQSLIDPEEQAKAVVDALNRVEQQRQELQVEISDAQAQYSALQQQLALSPNSALVAARLTQSSRFQGLLNELQQTELAIAEQRVIFTDLDPNLQVLLEERDNQVALLQQEIQRILGALPANLAGEDVAVQAGQLSQIDLSLAGDLVTAEATLQQLEARRQSLINVAQTLEADLQRYPDLIAEYDRIQPEVETERTVLERLLEERELLQAELARDGYNWQIVEPPLVGRKVAPNPKANVVLGAIAGLFLGGIAAFMRESMDRVVHTSAQLQQQTALPLLGILPAYRGAPLGIKFNGDRAPVLADSILARTVQAAPVREALDLIAKNIELLSAQADSKTDTLKSLMVSSALPDEGKTTLALGLALSAARLGQRVLVIDADLRRPTLHRELDLPNNAGLTVLAEGLIHQVKPASVSFGAVAIDVLTAGPEPSDPLRVLSSRRIKQLMSFLRKKYDLMVIDTPPVLGMADALQVGSFCDGVVLVARIDRITQPDLNQAMQSLSQIPLLGVVANGVKPSGSRYGDYGVIYRNPSSANPP